MTPPFETLVLKESARVLTVTLSRPERQNAINGRMLVELGQALDLAEGDPTCRFFVLDGQPGTFCTGMDFAEASGDGSGGEADRAEGYMALLRRFSLSPKVVVARVDGRVTAGGVGLAAASDFVLATERSQFALSEALWGLLPACVVPYLIRRVGFQKTYTMTLSTLPVPAREALAFHLVDEVADDLDEPLRRLLLRIGKLEESTIVELKSYFRRMWVITDAMERDAVDEISRLAAAPAVQENMRRFAREGRFPWDAR